MPGAAIPGGGAVIQKQSVCLRLRRDKNRQKKKSQFSLTHTRRRTWKRAIRSWRCRDVSNYNTSFQRERGTSAYLDMGCT